MTFSELMYLVCVHYYHLSEDHDTLLASIQDTYDSQKVSNLKVVCGLVVHIDRSV